MNINNNQRINETVAAVDSGSAAMERWYGKITGLCREDGEDRWDGLQLMNSAPF